ncbi:MAG: dephospho-CoA kinase [Thiobacillaceae bacterium]
MPAPSSQRPYCVGLTGGLAAGKSAVAACLAGLGAEVVDTDQIARTLTGPQGAALPAIMQAFGSGCIAPDGGLDRMAMRARVFADADARRRLEAILHPLILERVRERLAHSRAPYVVLVVPLLAEVWPDYRDLVDRVLVVDCDEALQISRVMQRDGIGEALARDMLAAQTNRQARLALADDVLDNGGDLNELARRVRDLHDRYLHLAKTRMDSLPGAG